MHRGTRVCHDLRSAHEDDERDAVRRLTDRIADGLRAVNVELDSRRQAMLDDLRKTGYKKERRDRNPLYR